MRRLIQRTLIVTIAFFLIPSLTHAYTGEVVKKIKTPGAIATGMTYDGQYIWIADRGEKLLYALDPETGEVQEKIQSPAYWPMGLAWDGQHLWNVDVKGGIPLSENYNGVVYKVDPENGTVLHTVSAPTNSPRGLTWDGKYLWCLDNSKDKIIQFNPNDGTTIKSFKAPASDPRGITFDGEYLWVSDRIQDELYMVSPENGEVILITEAPGKFTRGLAFFDDYLWAADSEEDQVFQLKVRDGQKYRRADPHRARVTFTHQVTNFGPEMLKEADVHIAVPRDRKSQELSKEITYTPGYTNLVTDKWDQQTAHFKQVNVKPGKTIQYEMEVEFTTYDVRWFIYPDEVGSLEDIPQDIRDKYLANTEKYQYDHPVIQKAVKEAVDEGEKNPYWIARDIFDYVGENLYYEMVGGWNTAPTVLARGNGSCSEYTYVYIAMCRSVGIPARYVGAVVRRGDATGFDDVFHRWVEIYLPNYGWITVDPQGGDKELPRDQANGFGHLPNHYLITTQSGGGSETMEWTYNSNDSWVTEPKTYVVSDYFADWEPLNEE